MREVPTKKPLAKIYKTLVFASLGNSLELYNYTLYGIMLPYISHLFFPSESAEFSLVMGYLSFALTFFIAPFGAIFWGWFGDRYGSLALLKFSMFLMAIPSLGIALLPTAQSVGITASVLLIVLRIVQGLSVSGEALGAKIFAMDELGEKHFGLSSGIISAMGAFGIIFAMLFAYLSSLYKEYPDFWRIPFLMGTLFYVLTISKRLRFAKSHIKSQSENKESRLTLGYLFTVVKEYPSSSLVVFALGALLGVLSYTLHAFITPFLLTRGIESSSAYALTIVSLVTTMMASVWSGFALDKKKDKLKSMKKNLLSILIFYLPLFACTLSSELFLVAIGLGGLGALLGAFATISAVVMFLSFPQEYRCRGLMFNYALGCSVFGGLTPIFLNFVVHTHSFLAGISVFLFTLFTYMIYQRGIRHVVMS